MFHVVCWLHGARFTLYVGCTVHVAQDLLADTMESFANNRTEGVEQMLLLKGYLGDNFEPLAAEVRRPVCPIR